MNRPIILAVLLAAVSAHATDRLDAARFTRLAAGARESALGGAISAVDAEPTALFSNPAGLARLDQAMSISADTAMLPVGQSLGFIGIAGWPQPELAVGLGVLFYGAGDDIEFRTGNSEEPVSLESAQSSAWAVGVAGHLMGPIWTGISLKLLSETLGKLHGTGYSSDIGFSYRPYRPVMLSAVLQNYLKPSMDWSAAPGRETSPPDPQGIDPEMRLGASFEGGNWRAMADGCSLSGPYPQWGLGAEWDAHPRITLRAGLQGLRPSVGFGSRLRYPGKLDSRLDYSFSPSTPTGFMHRFSLTLGLEIMKAEKDRMIFQTIPSNE